MKPAIKLKLFRFLLTNLVTLKNASILYDRFILLTIRFEQLNKYICDKILSIR